MSRREHIDRARETRLWIKMILGALVAIKMLAPDVWNTICDGVALAYYKVKEKIDNAKEKLNSNK